MPSVERGSQVRDPYGEVDDSRLVFAYNPATGDGKFVERKPSHVQRFLMKAKGLVRLQTELLSQRG